MKQFLRFSLGAALLAITVLPNFAQDPGATGISVANGRKSLQLPRFPGTDSYRVYGTTDLNSALTLLNSGSVTGFTWSASVTSPQEFYRVEAVPMSTNDTLAALVLNRLAYGPTPDELERVKSIGADAYIAEQLAPENIDETLDIDIVNMTRDWRRVVITGVPGNRNFYIYQTSPGDVYIDDLKVTLGTNPDAGTDVVLGGNFEGSLNPAWTVSTNMINSYIDTAEKNSGNSSLHIITTVGGTTQTSSIWQNFTNLSTTATYTLSFWWKPGTNLNPNLVLRFSGNGISTDAGGLSIATKLALNGALADDLRAWHVLHAVRSKKQLLEVLLQFMENHFVTQYTKTRDYFDQFYSGDEDDRWAAHFEYEEIQRWRAALLNPTCTFSNLLAISAESPAQIIYLDTVGSRGDGTRIPNENYAREILELYTFGVDNGYDQNDITLLSRAWTGWSVRIVDETNKFNPFAPQSTTRRATSTNTAVPIPVGELEGVWAFNYRTNYHWVRSSTTLFPNKTVPARFGAPWAGRSYQLVLPAYTAANTNSIQDGYKVIQHLANQPFTQEFISVKLCRLFVHDDFALGYNFADAETTPEEELIKACMMAWETNAPQGQIRKVLQVIFASELFRSQGAVLQKVKTPLEYTVSAIRALRTEIGGAPTATTDGYNIRSALDRMGAMRLFDRAEPDGYPEHGAPWISAGTLSERLRWVQSMLLPTTVANRDAGANTFADPVTLLRRKLPQADWNNASAVADYFLGLLLPGEGKANLDSYRTAAINFLNTADNGTPSPFATLINPSTTYDYRVRGMVGAIITSQRFHEQ